MTQIRQFVVAIIIRCDFGSEVGVTDGGISLDQCPIETVIRFDTARLILQLDRDILIVNRLVPAIARQTT